MCNTFEEAFALEQNPSLDEEYEKLAKQFDFVSIIPCENSITIE